jgi:integrase
MARGQIKKITGKRGASYKAIVDIGTDPDGGRKRKTRRFAGKKEAEKWLTDTLRAVDTGSYCDPGKVTVAEYLRRWLETHKVNLAPSTYRGYAVAVDKHIVPALGASPLQKLTPMMIQEYYAKDLESGRADNKKTVGCGLSPTTVAMHHRILRKALADAVRWQMIARNPADAVTAPKKAKKEIIIPTEQEVKKLLEALEGHYLYMAVFLAVYTGMRQGEVLGLKWADVDLDSGVIRVRQKLYQRKKGEALYNEPKAKSRRSIDIGAKVAAALKRHQKEQKKWRLAAGEIWQDTGLVCTLQNGVQIHPPTAGSRIRDIAGQLGVDASFHDLRHFHASLLLKQGVHPKIVSERLGHSQISLTMDTYSHLLPGVQRQAADILDEALT